MTPRTPRSGSLLTVFVFAASASVLAAAGCTDVEISAPQAPEIENAEFAAELGVDLSAMRELPSGVWIQDLETGDGEIAETGDGITVHFEGWLRNGSKFDSSRDRGQPLEITLTSTQVIQGWVEGVPGMREGGLRRMIIPPELGFGVQGTQNIPRNAILVFEVELLEVGEASIGN